jgi:hypothetical protein
MEQQIVGKFQKSNTHKFRGIGNLPTPQSYWFVLINQRNNKTKQIKRKKLFSTQLYSLKLSIFFCSHSLYSLQLSSALQCV